MVEWYQLSSVALLAASLLLYRIILGGRDSLSHIPYHRFDSDDTPLRYTRDSEGLLHSGYLKYTKKGIAYRMRNPVNSGEPQLILPFKYLDEVKNAPQNRLSFTLFSRLAFLLNESNAPQQTDAAVHMVRSDLNKNLPILVGTMQDECESALRTRFPDCSDWTAIQPYMLLAQTIAQISTRVLCGQELARNEEWIRMSVETAITVMRTGAMIRERFPPYLRWLAPYLLNESKRLLSNRKRAAEIIRPVYEMRMARMGDGTGYDDGIQWLIAAAGARTKTLQELADEQLFLSIVSIHLTTALTLSVLHDLADHPNCCEDIVEEIQKVQKEHGARWTKESLAKLEKLDSFMKESQRVHPTILVTVQRCAVKPYTFKDGLHLAANTRIAFPMAELNHDPDIWPDSETFDGHRFLRLRQNGDPNAWQFAFVGENSINFGAGAHACPGRYYASQEMKILIAQLLLRFEIEWPKGKSRPLGMKQDFATTPDAMADMMFRKRVV